jgi:hypothetical protein
MLSTAVLGLIAPTTAVSRGDLFIYITIPTHRHVIEGRDPWEGTANTAAA